MASEIKQVTCPFVVLAGGKSLRMGFPKGLLNFEGKLWIEKFIEDLLFLGFVHVVVVLGYDSELYLKTSKMLNLGSNQIAGGIKVDVVLNPQPERGPWTSLLTGVRKLCSSRSLSNGMLMSHVDRCPPNSELISRLVIHDQNKVVIPRWKNQCGHPVFLGRELTLDLLIRKDANRLDHYLAGLDRSRVVYLDVEPASGTYCNFNDSVAWAKFKRFYQERTPEKR